MRKRIRLAIATGLLFPTAILAQSSPDSILNTQARNLAVLYSTAIGSNSSFYNGPEYFYDDALLTANAFFETVDFDRGSIVYDGIAYYDIPLAYDIIRDEVVTLSFNQDYRVKILPEKLSSFTIRGRQFIQIPKATASHMPGYFELLHKGKASLLVKRIKKIKEIITTGRNVEYQVNSENQYYIQTSTGYHVVTDKAGLLSILSDKRPELNAYFDNNNYSFRTDLEIALLNAVKYYDQIAAE